MLWVVVRVMRWGSSWSSAVASKGAVESSGRGCPFEAVGAAVCGGVWLRAHCSAIRRAPQSASAACTREALVGDSIHNACSLMDPSLHDCVAPCVTQRIKSLHVLFPRSAIMQSALHKAPTRHGCSQRPMESLKSCGQAVHQLLILVVCLGSMFPHDAGKRMQTLHTLFTNIS